MINKIHIKDLEITYMGKTCSIADYVEYNDLPQTCPDLNKVGAIVYIKSIINRIDINRGMFGIDQLMELLQFDMQMCNFLLIKVIQRLNIKRVPTFVVDLINSKDEDEKFNLFHKFLKTTKLN